VFAFAKDLKNWHNIVFKFALFSSLNFKICWFVVFNVTLLKTNKRWHLGYNYANCFG
jgi:hypothetical protein